MSLIPVQFLELRKVCGNRLRVARVEVEGHTAMLAESHRNKIDESAADARCAQGSRRAFSGSQPKEPREGFRALACPPVR